MIFPHHLTALKAINYIVSSTLEGIISPLAAFRSQESRSQNLIPPRFSCHPDLPYEFLSSQVIISLNERPETQHLSYELQLGE